MELDVVHVHHAMFFRDYETTKMGSGASALPREG